MSAIRQTIMVHAAILALSLQAAGQTPKVDRELAEAVARGFEANRSAILHGSADFVFSMGTARDAATATSGAIENLKQAKGRYIFNSANRLFEIVYPIEDLTANRRLVGDRWSYFVHSKRVLTNGKLTLWDDQTANQAGDRIMHTTQIDQGDSRFFRELTFPLRLGDENVEAFMLHHDVDRSLRNRTEIGLEESTDDATHEGLPVVYLRFHSVDAEREYWVDLSRGSIPIRIAQKTETGTLEYYLDDLRLVNGTSWLPFKQTIFFSDGSVKRLVITDADFQSKPPASAFRMEFEEPMPIINTASSLRYPPQRVWDLSRLPSATSPSVRRVEAAPRTSEPEPQPGELNAGSGWGSLLIGLGAVLAVYFAVAHLRARRT